MILEIALQDVKWAFVIDDVNATAVEAINSPSLTQAA
jgi:hypothetical protein